MMKVWVWVTGQGSHPTSTTWKTHISYIMFQFADQMPVMINNVWISFPVSRAMLFKLTPGCLLYGNEKGGFTVNRKCVSHFGTGVPCVYLPPPESVKSHLS